MMRYPMLLRALLLAVVLVFSPVSLRSREKEKKLKAPSAERMQAINDSVLRDGLLLYMYERVQWQATDSLMKYGAPHLDQIDGSAMMALNGHTWKFVYVSLARREVMFEYVFDANTSEGRWDNAPRPITSEEERLAKVSRSARAKAIELKGDSIRLTSTAGLNWDCIPVGHGGYRLYLLHGTGRHGVQPFGDDYSFDFDADMNLTAWRSYHRSYMEIPVVGEKGKVEILAHSHTPMTPYVTPADIANFMLYGYNLYGIKQMHVYQTAFTEGYYSVFDAENMRLESIPAKHVK